jgi:hypothetical protein
MPLARHLSAGPTKSRRLCKSNQNLTSKIGISQPWAHTMHGRRTNIVVSFEHGASLVFHLEHFRIIKVSTIVAHKFTMNFCTLSVRNE